MLINFFYMSIPSDLNKYGQYKKDIFLKIHFNFIPGRNILDVGCGDGIDAKIFNEVYGLDPYAIDIYRDPNIDTLPAIHFQQAGIYSIPYPDRQFDYVFLHDVLHHIDEKGQSYEKHRAGLQELSRVTKQTGYILIVEGNRYNPLLYPHMVLLRKHNHWRQKYFIKIIKEQFSNVEFNFFECHFYPARYVKFWKFYEKIMEKHCPRQFLAYNVAIIKNG